MIDKLSPRQYQMLRMFASIGKSGLLGVKDGVELDNRTLRSMHYRGWADLIDKPRKGELGLRINEDGVQALRDFENADIHTHAKKRRVYSSYFTDLSPAFAGTFKLPQQEPKTRPVNIAHARRKGRRAA